MAKPWRRAKKTPGLRSRGENVILWYKKKTNNMSIIVANIIIFCIPIHNLPRHVNARTIRTQYFDGKCRLRALQIYGLFLNNDMFNA